MLNEMLNDKTNSISDYSQTSSSLNKINCIFQSNYVKI